MLNELFNLDPIDLTIDWGSEGAKCSGCCSNDFNEIDSIAASPVKSVRLWCCNCGHEFDFEYDTEVNEIDDTFDIDTVKNP